MFLIGRLYAHGHKATVATSAHLSTKLMFFAVKVQIIMPAIGKMFKFWTLTEA